MRKSDAVRVHHKKERWHERKSNRVRVDHEKKSDGVKVDHEKKINGLKVNHEKERWGESSP